MRALTSRFRRDVRRNMGRRRVVETGERYKSEDVHWVWQGRLLDAKSRHQTLGCGPVDAGVS